MSTELKKQLTDAGSWIVKGTIAASLGMGVFIFNDIRSSVDELHDDVKVISNVVIRLEEKWAMYGFFNQSLSDADELVIRNAVNTFQAAI